MIYRGEVMLFDNLRQAIDPASRSHCIDGNCQSQVRCISGVFVGATPPNLRALDGRHVTVRGKVIDYRSLPNEQTAVLPRKLLAGKIVSNFCLRDEVLLITSLRPT
jgi:hypothetical protein